MLLTVYAPRCSGPALWALSSAANGHGRLVLPTCCLFWTSPALGPMVRGHLERYTNAFRVPEHVQLNMVHLGLDHTPCKCRLSSFWTRVENAQ